MSADHNRRDREVIAEAGVDCSFATVRALATILEAMEAGKTPEAAGWDAWRRMRAAGMPEASLDAIAEDVAALVERIEAIVEAEE